jgi:hypothetical protein
LESNTGGSRSWSENENLEEQQQQEKKLLLLARTGKNIYLGKEKWHREDNVPQEMYRQKKEWYRE